MTPSALWVKVSGCCNLRCVGCGYSKGERFPTLDEMRLMLVGEGITEISLTGVGEALLNPLFAQVVDLCREMHPSAKLWVILNGMVPLTKGRRSALANLDSIGLSMDGSTRETYESIRVGATFETFMANATEIAALGPRVGFSFTATSTNLHELSGVIQLAAKLGIPEVYAQPMTLVEGVNDQIAGILLDTMDPMLRTTLVDAAKAEAERLGITFSGPASLYPGPEAEPSSCRCPWTSPPQIQLATEGYLVLPCCWIAPSKLSLLGARYGLRYETIPPMADVFNSPGYDQFRSDLQSGLARDICGNCHAAGYFQ